MRLGEKMMSWTRQRGHPVVMVTRLNDTFIRVEQSAFLRNSENRADRCVTDLKLNNIFRRFMII